jgi:hypothetical protein
MRCNYLLNNQFALLPEMLAWVSLGLGRTIDDTPDVWSALRESYIKSDFDNYPGELNLVYYNGRKEITKSITINGNHQLKTATVFIENLEANSMNHIFDFVLEAGEQTENIIISIVRAIRL